MAAGPLVETKLFLPQPRGDAVARPRLTELLDRGRRARLTLVSAPAGFGKTTLLARWLASARCRVSGRSPGSPWRRATASPRGSGPTWSRRSNGRSRRSAAVRWRCCRRRPACPRQCPGHPHQRAEHGADRAGPRPRRLPPRRQPGPATERGLPPRAPSAPGPPGHQHPRRPGAAAGPPARPGRPRRDPCRRPALHADRGRGLPQRHRRARAHRQRHRRAGVAHRGLDRRPAAGGAVPAGACRPRRRSSPPSPATTATSWTTWSKRCSAANRRRSATSCSRPPSSTG